jgi:hypothetical protein
MFPSGVFRTREVHQHFARFIQLNPDEQVKMRGGWQEQNYELRR